MRVIHAKGRFAPFFVRARSDEPGLRSRLASSLPVRGTLHRPHGTKSGWIFVGRYRPMAELVERHTELNEDISWSFPGEFLSVKGDFLFGPIGGWARSRTLRSPGLTM